MKHLSDMRLLDLAQKINMELDFTSQDRRDMMHIAACEDCYQLLRLTMLTAEAADHIGETISLTQPAPEAPGENAIIRIVVVNMAAMMEQLQAESALWSFSESLSFSGVRSAGETAQVEKLEDDDTSKTYIAYDPASRTLVIQLDADTVGESPRALLKYSDGTVREIPLEKRGDIYWGRVTDLADGEYRVILEK